MSKQIMIRWDSRMDSDYKASINALRQYSPPPVLTATIRLKGSMPEEAIDRIVWIAENYGLEVNLTLTGTWTGEDDIRQFRLFPPTEVVTQVEKLVENALVGVEK